MFDLTNKVIFITGGSRGIGAAIALGAARTGASVAITYTKNKESAEKVVGEIRSLGGSALALKANVADARQVRNAIARTVRKFGSIDILVNNAGVWKHAPIATMTEAQWDETIDINLKGMFLTTREVIPYMKKQKGGRIINIASTAGQRGEPEYSHYAASKGGMIAFTKAVGAELAPFNIRVNCVSPGWVETDMTEHVFSDKKRKGRIDAGIPRGRVAIPEDIVGPVLFLCTEFSDHLIGTSINVNGGGVMV